MKFVLQFLLLWMALTATHAQTLTNGQSWRYQLTEGAALQDDCPACGRPTILQPLYGAFDLVGTSTAGKYVLTNIVFTAATRYPRIEGSGTLTVQGAEQVLTLDVLIFPSDAGERIHMTNAVTEDRRIFPMISAQAIESPGSLIRVYTLHLIAAPLHELWFSTSSNFTNAQNQIVSHGDLLSTAGRIVKRNAELTDRLATPAGDLGLDALDIGPRGEIFFSTTTNVESAVNGSITHSDVVTSHGRVYLQIAQLLSAFGVDDPDAGLDALHILSDDEVFFSITKDIPRTGANTLRRGDILSNKGRIVRSESAVFLRWLNPITVSPGLDALYIWPNGEVWFSTETDFTGPSGLPISAGDIISDQGYVAYKNARLFKAFGLPEQFEGAGLDAMFIIADPAASKAPIRLDYNWTPSGFEFTWESAARVFQLERAFEVQGRYVPWSELTTDHNAHDAPNRPNLFYRLRQW